MRRLLGNCVALILQIILNSLKASTNFRHYVCFEFKKSTVTWKFRHFTKESSPKSSLSLSKGVYESGGEVEEWRSLPGDWVGSGVEGRRLLSL